MKYYITWPGHMGVSMYLAENGSITASPARAILFDYKAGNEVLELLKKNQPGQWDDAHLLPVVIV